MVTMPENDRCGAWGMEGRPQAVTWRQALLHRLQKADGHINAAERKLWHETDRALWSAHQAQARVAEVWLGLVGSYEELPALERYLSKDVMHMRLEDFAKVAKPASRCEP